MRLQFKSSLDLDDEPVDSLDESDDEDGVITILLDGVSSLGALLLLLFIFTCSE